MRLAKLVCSETRAWQSLQDYGLTFWSTAFAIRSASGTAQVQKITPHDLRHTCASLAVSAGVNVLALQRMPEHMSAKVTLDTYADLFDDDLDAVATALDTAREKNVVKMWSPGAQDSSS